MAYPRFLIIRTIHRKHVFLINCNVKVNVFEYDLLQNAFKVHREQMLKNLLQVCVMGVIYGTFSFYKMSITAVDLVLNAGNLFLYCVYMHMLNRWQTFAWNSVFLTNISYIFYQ